jgi:hypothetical protein
VTGWQNLYMSIVSSTQDCSIERGVFYKSDNYIWGVSLRVGSSAYTAQALFTACTEAPDWPVSASTPNTKLRLCDKQNGKPENKLAIYKYNRLYDVANP